MAWGQSQLVVEAKSPEQAKEIAYKLNQFGFKAVDDEGDADAGTLTHPYFIKRCQAFPNSGVADL